MSNLQGRFVGLKQIRRQANFEASAVFAGITESDLQCLDEEVDLSTFHFPEDDLLSGSLNSDKDNQQNNLLNISNQQDNNSNNCNELYFSSDGLSNAEINDNMEIDHINEEIRIRHDLLDKAAALKLPALAQMTRVMQTFRPILCLRNCAWNVQYNVTLNACRALLKIFQPSYPELPLHPRIFNRTPRKTVVENLQNGSYWSMLV